MADLLPLVFIAAAGLSTALGGIPLVAIRSLTHRRHDTILGFVGGVMLGVAVFDLFLHLTTHPGQNWLVIVVGTLAGAVTIVVLVRVFMRLPLPMPFANNSKSLTAGSAALLFLALVIHNAPEGLATGVGYADGVTKLGNSIGLSIAFQNIPEGLLVGIAVMSEAGSWKSGFKYAALSGLVEPVAGYIAFFTLTLSPQTLGFVSAFAGGAMLSVVFTQVIPESHRHGYHVPATLALLLGVAAAAGINLLLGQLSF